MLEHDWFRRLVEKEFGELLDEFGDEMKNVAVVVEDWPDRGTLHRAGLRSAAQLLGFYHGVPRIARNQGYNLVAPDHISIYRRPIELVAHTPDQVRETVARVLRHEIAHHFGIDDERLDELDAY